MLHLTITGPRIFALLFALYPVIDVLASRICQKHRCIICSMPANAREDDETYQSPVDLLFSQLAEWEPDHFAVKQYRKFKMAAGDVCSK